MIEHGLPLVIVQPGAVYGPGDTSALGMFFRHWLRGRAPTLPKHTDFCWAHVDDVARGHILAMNKGTPGESYIIAGPCHTLEAAFEMAAQITGKKAPSIRVGPPLMRGLAKVMKTIGTVVPLPEMYTAESLRVSAGVTYLGDNSKARRELGYDPRPLAEGLPDMLRPMMEELNG